MLTKNQEKYLLTIPKDKVIHIKPFDPKVKETAGNIISKIKSELPKAEVYFLGASALGIAGQNDIDMTILANGKFTEYSEILGKIFAGPAKSNPNLIKWEFVRDGFEVELYLNDKISPVLQEQIDTFNLLKINPELCKEYEQIKKEADGLSFREYMKRKYEFFNRILGLDKVLLNKITDNLSNNKSIILVGPSGSGKTYWIKNELIPALEKEKRVVYSKDGDSVDDTDGDIFIFDEAETLFDREFLEKRHPDEQPYYTEVYLNKINLWYEKYKSFDKPCVYVITRNEYLEIQNLVQNFKHTDWDNREVETICFSSFLYHGSTTPNIKVLEPRHRYSPAGKIEYDAIYATPMKGYAVAHSFPWSTDEGVDLDIIDDKVVFAVPKSFKNRLQVPISIYKISSENFVHTKEEQTGRTWHTIEATPVIDEEKFESVEIALKQFGVDFKYKS